MSQPDPKRVKTSDDDTPYTLIYWPGIPGRGEFVRLLFVESGTPYTDLAKDDPKTSVSTIQSIASDTGDDTNPAKFAPPVLRHGDLLLSQVPNILLYLGPRLGLSPPLSSSLSGNAVAAYHINELALTLLDGLSNEAHETHHPVGTSLYYEDQKPEAKRRAKNFTNERLPKFLAYIQRVLDSKTSGDGPWLYGDSLTYADLVLFQGLDGCQFAFPKTVKKLKESGKYDGVFKVYEAVKERPNIKEYLAGDRRAAYSEGIWRHYPELEE